MFVASHKSKEMELAYMDMNMKRQRKVAHALRFNSSVKKMK